VRSVSPIRFAATLLGGAALLGGLAACRTTSAQVPAWAFGVTLGEVLDKTTAQPIDALIAGRALYRIRPPRPHRSVSDYALITDRPSGVVVGVVGWDRYSVDSACERERAAVAAAVERRYGAGRPAQAADRELMKGLPESLGAPDLMVYPGWQGPLAIGCSGSRLLIAYWWVKPESAAPGAAGESK
jgi:hypothetical protein